MSAGHVLLYGGTTSRAFRTAFVNVARTDEPVFALFYDRQLSRGIRFVSRNILSSRHTSIQSLEWTLCDALKIAASAGIGNNARYGSASIDLSREWISFQGSYTRAGSAFRRVQIQEPLVAETNGGSFQLQWRPKQNLALTLSRQTYLNPNPAPGDSGHATVNGLGFFASAKGVRMGGSLFHSRVGLQSSNAAMFSVERSFSGHFDASMTFARSTTAGGTVRTVTASFRERLTRRWTFSQAIRHSGGQTSVLAGGGFTSNRFTLTLEHQTIYVPFAGRGGSPFRQILVVSLRLRLPHDVQLQGATNLSPAGRWRYTGDVSTFFYPSLLGRGTQLRGSGRIAKYVVCGRVLDENGRPVPGAALQIEDEIALTNTQGAFLLRVNKPRRFRLKVLTDQFMFAGDYEVVLAPESVASEREEIAQVHEILIRRLLATRTERSEK